MLLLQGLLMIVRVNMRVKFEVYGYDLFGAIGI